MPADDSPTPTSNIPHVWIKSIVFSDDTNLEFSPSDVIVVVGPNNAGKSAALRAIRDKLQSSDKSNPVIKQISIGREGTASDLLTWLDNWTVKNYDNCPQNPVLQALGLNLRRGSVEIEWERTDQSLGNLTRWFCHLLSADERLQISNPPDNIALTSANPVHPIHFIQRDDALEEKLSAKFRKAFGEDLVVNRNAGNQVPLHVGDRPTPSNGEDRVSPSYVIRLERLPLLHKEGDGMRSFAGVLLATSVGRESIILIDEPEAFLHPPQARFLGNMLVQDRLRSRQLFVATHSSDILRGMIDAESDDLRVIRIQRQGDVNVIRQLDNGRIKELWSDPLLRHSNILDGLFHERVIVCEADSDCRFFSAILDSLYSSDVEDVRRHPDLMFTQCGGKDRLPVVVRALREVDVPVVAVADFDILSEEQPLRNVVEALGMDWNALAPDWRQVKSAIDAKKPELNSEEVKRKITTALAKVTDTLFPIDVKEDIQKILRCSSPWSHAKSVGKRFVPPGDPSVAVERLLANLRTGGLHVVEVGELEGFVKTVGNHGPKWVNEVLKRELSKDPELQEARMFVQRFIPSTNE